MMQMRGGMDRIKDLLQAWAGWQDPGHTAGYPRQVAFANERVQNDNHSVETYREMPLEVKQVNTAIEALAPNFKCIVALEYLDRRPQKTKAAVLGIPRQVFSQRLLWIHEQLTYTMWG